MPKSRKRKARKSYIQVIPLQKAIPIGTELVDDPENPGTKIHQTKVALVKLNETKTIRHLPQKKN